MEKSAHKGSLKARYERLWTDRQQFLDRARQCAELTLPTLIPPEGHTHTTKYYTPWQGIGARGVNTLASKLLLALLPPNAPFFKLQVDDFTKDSLLVILLSAQPLNRVSPRLNGLLQQRLNSPPYVHRPSLPSSI